jgi:hypothetical protein
MKKTFCKNRLVLTLIILLLGMNVILSSYKIVGVESIVPFNENKKIIGKITRNIEIPAKSDYYIRFLSENLTLEGENKDEYTSGLSEKIKNAIAKSPKWIQRDLTRQFLSIDGEEYADLILEMDKRYVDEIAFSLAHSRITNAPSTDIIKENVLVLYENDEWIKYADIIDYDDNQGNYYSTIRYCILENDTEKHLEYLPKIYYWHVVHPDMISKANYIYDKFWRDYLFNHNDLGYPLLKEKLSEIYYLWDCKSYSQPSHRLWKWSLDNHPTAIEAISYWVGKTVPEQAYGDRPGQPNVIAHQHNGWCGELKTLAVAAFSTALVPSIPVSNAAEDHVWREFYERGWHQSDNWWADTGGVVDNPDIYAYGWGKDMSAIYATKCDSSIYEVTSTYIHPEDRKTMCFQVLDRKFQPVDGARVTVSVQGPKDITWIKYKLLEQVENIWDLIPPYLRGKIFEFLYNKIIEKIESVPDIVDGLTYSVWNFTDLSGKCSFELGQNRSYLFIIQYGDLKSPLMPVRYNKIRILKNPVDKSYVFWLPFLSPIKDKHYDEEMLTGDIDFKVSFDTKSYQLQGKLSRGDEGVYEGEGKIDFFIVDEDNFNKYRNGESFICYNYISKKNDDFIVKAQKNNWYLIFRNKGRISNIILNFSVTVEISTTIDRVQIVYPDTDIFDIPIFNIGDTIRISGIATDDILLKIDGEQFEVISQNYEWNYFWNTSKLSPGNYSIIVECGDDRDEILSKLIDFFPPEITIDSPYDGEIIENDFFRIEGHAFDDSGVDRIEVSFDDGEWIEASGTDYWFIDWDVSNYSIGDYKISARAFDIVGGVSIDEISIVLNESGHSCGGIINSYYHQPDYPTNLSNIIIFANVTSGSEFSNNRVVLYWNDGIETKRREMFMYADNPVQDRHDEDPLKNMSNDPIFGLELGQFSTGTNISYWIGVFDTANNSVFSSKKYLNIMVK